MKEDNIRSYGHKETEKEESVKVMETKNKIKEAFFDIYENKKLEKISIKEITDRANLNRSTFYVYYQDIYELLEKIEEDIILELTGKIRGAVKDILREDKNATLLPPIEFYRKNSRYLRMLLGENGDPGFLKKLKQIAKKNLREILKQENLPIVPQLDYILEYVASAQIGILTFWMEKEMELPVEELEKLIIGITMNGPYSCLKKQINSELG